MNEYNPSVTGLLDFFAYLHLPEPLRSTSEMISEVAYNMADTLDGPELITGLRKLLEAKDCFVRAQVAMRVAEAGREVRQTPSNESAQAMNRIYGSAEEIDLDEEIVLRADGTRITEADAEEQAEEILDRTSARVTDERTPEQVREEPTQGVQSTRDAEVRDAAARAGVPVDKHANNG